MVVRTSVVIRSKVFRNNKYFPLLNVCSILVVYCKVAYGRIGGNDRLFCRQMEFDHTHYLYWFLNWAHLVLQSHFNLV